MTPPNASTPRALEFQEWLVARSDASQHAGQAAATRRLIQGVALRPGERLLDVGCGSAKSAVLAANSGARVVALDRSERSLDRARARARRHALGRELALLRGEAARLPLRSSSFDVAILEAVAYAADLPPLLGEIARILRPGGRLGLVDIARRPDREPPVAEFRQLLGERTFNLLTVEQWGSSVRAAGFEVTRAERFPIRQELATVRAELGDWLRSLPRQIVWLARSREARRLFFANYRVGLDRGIEGCLLVAFRPPDD